MRTCGAIAALQVKPFQITLLAIAASVVLVPRAVTAQSAGAVTTAIPATPAAQLIPAEVKPFEAILDEALDAYNAEDAARFLACFGKAAMPPAEPRVFAAVFVGVYQSEFGDYVSKQLNTKETVPDADRGVLVYDAVFDKRKVKLSANFLREQGALKLVQIRMEKR